MSKIILVVLAYRVLSDILQMGFSSAVLAHFILKERLHKLGILGCVMCIAGSVIIVIHAPMELPITSVQEIWNMATQPG